MESRAQLRWTKIYGNGRKEIENIGTRRPPGWPAAERKVRWRLERKKSRTLAGGLLVATVPARLLHFYDSSIQVPAVHGFDGEQAVFTGHEGDESKATEADEVVIAVRLGKGMDMNEFEKNDLVDECDTKLKLSKVVKSSVDVEKGC